MGRYCALPQKSPVELLIHRVFSVSGVAGTVGAELPLSLLSARSSCCCCIAPPRLARQNRLFPSSLTPSLHRFSRRMLTPRMRRTRGVLVLPTSRTHLSAVFPSPRTQGSGKCVKLSTASAWNQVLDVPGPICNTHTSSQNHETHI